MDSLAKLQQAKCPTCGGEKVVHYFSGNQMEPDATRPCFSCKETGLLIPGLTEPCGYDSSGLKGQPIGMFHCPQCGEMMLAGEVCDEQVPVSKERARVVLLEIVRDTLVVEERDGYWAARTVPFALTVYGKSAEQAEERALEAVIFAGGDDPLAALASAIAKEVSDEQD